MKKLFIVSILVLITGGILIAVAVTSPVQMNAAEVTAIKSNCAQCHTVPSITSAKAVHAAHNGFECATCHKSSSSNGEGDEEEGPVNISVCAGCHKEPVYTDAQLMHNAHATTDCNVCHTETAGLATAENAHDIMKKIGIGLVIFVIAGLFLNSVIARIRLNRKEKSKK